MYAWRSWRDGAQIVAALGRQLGWAHFKLLIPLKEPLKREFYAEMCRAEAWSTRTLAHKIDGMLYERTALSKKPERLIRKELAALREKGARQKRIVLDGDDYYIDLLFFHRRLRRLVAIELKIGDFKPADSGQVELYLRWLDRHERQPSEEAPLGIILCAGKKRETVEYLDLDARGIHVAEYLTELPPREVLQERLHRALAAARNRLALGAIAGSEGERATIGSPTGSEASRSKRPSKAGGGTGRPTGHTP